jgi:hypothetical protein
VIEHTVRFRYRVRALLLWNVPEQMLNGTSRLVGVFAAVLAVGACGKVTSSKADAGGDGGLAANQACATLAQAECGKRDICSTGTSITRVYGEMSVCLTRAALECTTRLGAPNTGASPQAVSKCAADYAALSCNDFFDGKLPADCTPSGPGANGQPCAFNGQCATAYCGGDEDALCGTCEAQPAAGDSCAGSFCGPGQNCVAATMTCEEVGILNGSCDTNDPCGNGLSCVGVSSTSTEGTCEVALGTAGAACGGGTTPGCNGSLGLACVGATGSKTCVTISYVSDGMPCGNLSNTAFALCKAGTCYTPTGVASGSEMGTCKVDAIEGAACDTALGPSCMTPARCIVGDGGTSGLCALPTGSTCGS